NLGRYPASHLLRRIASHSRFDRRVLRDDANARRGLYHMGILSRDTAGPSDRRRRRAHGRRCHGPARPGKRRKLNNHAAARRFCFTNEDVDLRRPVAPLPPRFTRPDCDRLMLSCKTLTRSTTFVLRGAATGAAGNALFFAFVSIISITASRYSSRYFSGCHCEDMLSISVFAILSSLSFNSVLADSILPGSAPRSRNASARERETIRPASPPPGTPDLRLRLWQCRSYPFRSTPCAGARTLFRHLSVTRGSTACRKISDPPAQDRRSR